MSAPTKKDRLFKKLVEAGFNHKTLWNLTAKKMEVRDY